MKPLKSNLIMAIPIVLGLASCNPGKQSGDKAVVLDPANMTAIGSVDERFQSYNVEMAEIIGGNFWKPYDKQQLEGKKDTVKKPAANKSVQVGIDKDMFQALPPIDLYNARLRKLAAALGPAYIRVSGTWANSVFFQDSDGPALKTPPKGFKGVLTRAEWKGVFDFSKAADAKVITSFAISDGARNAAGIWVPAEAKKILDYTKAIGGNIAAAELFNEPNVAAMGGAPKGYNAAAYTKDIAAFKAFAKTAAPGMLIVGPGSVGEGVNLMPKALSTTMLHSSDLLSTQPKPDFDVFSYHYYGAVSQRCAIMGPDMGTTPEAAMTEKWLSRTDTALTFYKALRDKFAPGKPIWVTETADAACGGNPWATSFIDCFRYLDQMGRLAKGGVSVIYHNTLTSSEYGLLEQKTHLPRPHYWAALLWHNLMGTTVLNAGASQPGLFLYAHNMKNHAGGVTILAINIDQTKSAFIDIPKDADRYTLSAQKLRDNSMLLNGKEIKLGPNDEMPDLKGTPVKSGRIELPPATITFLTIADAGNKNSH